MEETLKQDLEKIEEEIIHKVNEYNENKINTIITSFQNNNIIGKIQDNCIDFYCFYIVLSDKQYADILDKLQITYLSDTVTIAYPNLFTNTNYINITNIFNSIFLINIINMYKNFILLFDNNSDKEIVSFIKYRINYLEYLVKYCSYIKFPQQLITLDPLTQYKKLFYKEFLIIYEDLGLISNKTWKQLLYITSNIDYLKNFLSTVNDTTHYYNLESENKNLNSLNQDHINAYYQYHFFYLTISTELSESLELDSLSKNSLYNVKTCKKLFIFDLVKYLISEHFCIYKLFNIDQHKFIYSFELWCKLKCKLLKFKYIYKDMVNKLKTIINDTYNRCFDNKKQLYYHLYLRRDTTHKNPRFEYEKSNMITVTYNDYPYTLIPTNLGLIDITSNLEEDNNLYKSAKEWSEKTINYDVIFRYDDDNVKYIIIKYNGEFKIYECTYPTSSWSWLSKDIIDISYFNRSSQLNKSQHTTSYKHVYDFYDETYIEKHEKAAKDFAINLIKQINYPICIINNGLTGAGKTSFTLYRKDENGNPIFGALYYFLLELMNKSKDNTIKIQKGQADEIYSKYEDTKYTKTYSICTDAYQINNETDISTILNRIIVILEKDRQTALTLFNPASSRSHLIIYLDIQFNDKNNDSQQVRLLLLDLAGRENMFLCDTPQTRMKLLDLYISHNKLEYIKDYTKKMESIDESFENKYKKKVLINKLIDRNEIDRYNIMEQIAVFHTPEDKSSTKSTENPMDNCKKKYDDLYAYFNNPGLVTSRTNFQVNKEDTPYQFYWDHSIDTNNLPYIKTFMQENMWFSHVHSIPPKLTMIINFKSVKIYPISISNSLKPTISLESKSTLESFMGGFEPVNLLAILKKDIIELDVDNINGIISSLESYLKNIDANITRVIKFIVSIMVKQLDNVKKNMTDKYGSKGFLYTNNTAPHLNLFPHLFIFITDNDKQFKIYHPQTNKIDESNIDSKTKEAYNILVRWPIEEIIEICKKIIEIKKDFMNKMAQNEEKLKDYNAKFKQYILVAEECNIRSHEGEKINKTLIKFKTRLATSYGYNKIINNDNCADMEFFEYPSDPDNNTYEKENTNFGEDEEIMQSIHKFLGVDMKDAKFNILNIVNMSDSILLNNPPYPPYIDITDIIYFKNKLSAVFSTYSTNKVNKLTILIRAILKLLIQYILKKCTKYKYYNTQTTSLEESKKLIDGKFQDTAIDRVITFIDDFIKIIETNNELTVIGSMYPLKAATSPIYISCSTNNYLATIVSNTSYEKLPKKGTELVYNTFKKLLGGSIFSQNINLKTATNNLHLAQTTHQKQLLSNNKDINKINYLNKNNIDNDYVKYIKYKHKYLKLKAAILK